MNNNYKYILEKYNGMKTRFRCPQCNDTGKTFARYIDTETNEYLHNTVGKCNRDSNCGYHYTPKQYFIDNKQLLGTFFVPQNTKPKAFVLPEPTKPTFIPFDAFKLSLCNYSENNFVSYLNTLFGELETKNLIEKYYLGTSKQWKGANIFWQIDINRKIRTGRIMLYDTSTGKRDKYKFNWVHKLINNPDFKLLQCFFGEHLLIGNNKPVAIVESEKTAIICSVYFPNFIWLGAGGKHGLNIEKFKVLRGRKVILFPDLSKDNAKENCFDLWTKKAKEFSEIASISVSDYLENIANDTEKLKGLDIADYVIQTHYISPIVEVKKESDYIDSTEPLPATNENWDNEVLELETFFNSTILPTHPIKLNQCAIISNVSTFIKNHLSTIKQNNGKLTFLPFLNRLQELKQTLNN